MTSFLLSRVSAAVLLLGGVAVLFVPDLLLPVLVPGFPPTLWAAFVPMAALATIYGALLLRGPFEPLQRSAS